MNMETIAETENINRLISIIHNETDIITRGYLLRC